MKIISCLLCFFSGLATLPFSAREAKAGGGNQYPEPAYEEAIQEFERLDKMRFPPLGEIVVIGDSNIRRWETIHEDFAPLTVIQRGFGGSTFNDALHYAERIVIPYRPRAVVISAGANDLLAYKIDPETIRDTLRAFVEKVRARLPNVRIYVNLIIPCIYHWKTWPLQEKYNDLIREYCKSDGRLVCLDMSKAILGADGQPRKELFCTDDPHMNREGYRACRGIIMPAIMNDEEP